MALIVEDGTGNPNADAYVSLSDFLAYAATVGFDLTPYSSQQEEQAIRRATVWLDGRYMGEFGGQRQFFRTQALEWPRYGVVDINGFIVEAASIPREIKRATYEAAWRELQAPNSLAPDLDRGGAIKQLTAGPLTIIYADGASPQTVFQQIDIMLAGLIMNPQPYTANAANA